MVPIFFVWLNLGHNFSQLQSKFKFRVNNACVILQILKSIVNIKTYLATYPYLSLIHILNELTVAEYLHLYPAEVPEYSLIAVY